MEPPGLVIIMLSCIFSAVNSTYNYMNSNVEDTREIEISRKQERVKV